MSIRGPGLGLSKSGRGRQTGPASGRNVREAPSNRLAVATAGVVDALDCARNALDALEVGPPPEFIPAIVARQSCGPDHWRFHAKHRVRGECRTAAIRTSCSCSCSPTGPRRQTARRPGFSARRDAQERTFVWLGESRGISGCFRKLDESHLRRSGVKHFSCNELTGGGEYLLGGVHVRLERRVLASAAARQAHNTAWERARSRCN